MEKNKTEMSMPINKLENDVEFIEVGQIPIVYMVTTNADIHKGKIKIGKAHISENDLHQDLNDNSAFLEAIARERTKEYCNTAGLKVKVYFVGLRKGPNGMYLWDHAVHDVLESSGISHVEFPGASAREWYEISLEVAMNALNAASEGRQYLSGSEKKIEHKGIVLREEQEDAIEKTLARFKEGGTRMLWNAKMRFGKTITALALVKKAKYKRVLLATHRPAVNDGWFKDFQLIFENNEYLYGSKKDGQEDVKYPLSDYLKKDKPFIYFISIQDLRGSKHIYDLCNPDDKGSEKGIEKNCDIFTTKWDLVVIDEAHEGTTTNLGKALIEALHTKYVIALSGTPFNLFSQYKENEVYTWDYIAEQKRKRQWPLYHGAAPNPYIGLPEMRMYAYDLAATMPEYRSKEIQEESWFSFAEFFKVNESGYFIHEEDVDKFLTLISTENERNNYPFSSVQKQNMFRHTFWRIPGVKEGEALKKRMQNHYFFSQYAICNVAGDDGDYTVDGRKEKDPLTYVRKQIKNVEEDLAKPEKDRVIRKEGTITLSCGKLTTGVSVPEWTGVFMLSGGEEIAAAQYLQTIFRVQTPYTSPRTGAMKAYAYVFDFAPDRCLRVLAESLSIADSGRVSPPEKEEGVESCGEVSSGEEFPQYCALIIEKGSKLTRYDAREMLRSINRIHAEEMLRTGFDTNKIFKPEFLKNISYEDISKYAGIINKIFKSTSGAPKKLIQISSTTSNSPGSGKKNKKKIKGKGEVKKGKSDKNSEETAFEKALEQFKAAFRMLFARLPLLIFASDEAFDEDYSLNNFIDSVDDLSWKEFLPITKEEFKQIAPIVKADAIADTGYLCRQIAKDADVLSPEERVIKIAELIARFKNPDKETVLTPWRVVNMHLSDTIGGWCFFDEKFDENPIEDPRYVSHESITNNIFKIDTNILEMNAKTGLYSLYIAFSIFKNLCKIALARGENLSNAMQQKLWKQVVENNIHILCATKMAAAIARRTLLGYQEGNLNIVTIEHLSEKIKNCQEKVIKNIKNPLVWNKKGLTKMNFDAIVGNPPYQLKGGSGGSNDAPIYQEFASLANKINPTYTSLIMPARWFSAGRENLLGDFRAFMLKNKSLKKLITFTDASLIFSTVSIKGGVCYYLIDKNYTGLCDYKIFMDGKFIEEVRDLGQQKVLIREPMLANIVKKVQNQHNENNVDSLISNDTPFGISSNFKTSKKKVLDWFDELTANYNVLLYYVESTKRKTCYINIEDISKHVEDIEKHKVFVPGAAGSGSDKYVIGKPEYAPPYSVCSQTYLYAAFDREIEARNFIKYMHTLFFRALVASVKISQSAPQRVYQYVPIQDFSLEADIDWNDNLENIDSFLFEKYDLSNDEIKYIKNRIAYL